MCHLAGHWCTSAALQQLYMPPDSDYTVSGTGLLTACLHVDCADLCHRSLCAPSAGLHCRIMQLVSADFHVVGRSCRMWEWV